MDGKSSRGDDVGSLLDAIKASELLETRIELLVKLSASAPLEIPELDAVLEFVTELWESFTCLDISQCMLNKAIIDVAAKHVEGDSLRCQGRLLTMGTLASDWCAKHLKMTLMSTGDSQEEEHYNLFFQLLVECLNFSAACFSMVTRSPVLGDQQLMDGLEKFILEQLNLIKDLISEIKKIQSFVSELLKGSELILDSALKLCKAYAQMVDWDLHDIQTQKDSSELDKGAANLNLVSKLIKCVIEKLSEIGILAADGGGSLVTILNLSWKGVVSLLQLGKGTLAEKVNVGEIIMSLISLAKESLRCAAESWSVSLEQPISVTESKRVFLPIKFYLINAVRICSQYPHPAYCVYREVNISILLLTTMKVVFSRKMFLKNVCEVMEELLKPTSLHLLNTLLNSPQLNVNQKLQVLDSLFGGESGLPYKHSDHHADLQKAFLDDVFSVATEVMATTRALLVGRVALFIDILKLCFGLEEDIVLGITRRLQWLFDILVDEEAYSFTLVLDIPASCGDGKSLVLTWEPMLTSLLHALKIFMIFVSGTRAWSEMEFFLLDNFFHPHFLCSEIIMELWCFLVRHAESNTVNVVMDKLCSLYKTVAHSDSQLSAQCALRKMARSMCLLLNSCPPSVVDRVYRSIVTDDRSHVSAFMYAALLMEGFQINLLSDNLRTAATERIYNDYIHFVDEYSGNLMHSGSSSNVFGIPVTVLCSTLQSMQIDASAVDKRTLKLLLASIQTYKASADRTVKNDSCRLLSEALVIISTAKHLYSNDQMEQVLIELKNMFISGPNSGASELQKCKPALASFMSGLGHVEMAECEESVKTCAVWQLYHMLLREKHWALIHLAISAFGYFAARTSCNQLWRFVPPDASLSFDLESGTNAQEDRFMSELKVFLEKEMALPTTAASSSEQFDLIFKDGLILKERFLKNSSSIAEETLGCKPMDVISGEELSNKRRKLPDGFSRGMALLQNGVKVMGDGLSSWRQNHHDNLDDKILTQFSRLEDIVNHLAGLADSG